MLKFVVLGQLLNLPDGCVGVKVLDYLHNCVELCSVTITYQYLVPECLSWGYCD